MMDADWYCPQCAFDVGECKCEPPKIKRPPAMSNHPESLPTGDALADEVAAMAGLLISQGVNRYTDTLMRAAAALRSRQQVAEGERYMRALVDIMDGIPDHDIQAETGLPDADCFRIANCRREAKAMLAAAKEPHP